MLDAPVCWAEGVRAPLWQPGAGKARCGRHFGRQCVCPSNPCVLLLLLLLLLLPLGDRLWKTPGHGLRSEMATYAQGTPTASYLPPSQPSSEPRPRFWVLLLLLRRRRRRRRSLPRDGPISTGPLSAPATATATAPRPDDEPWAIIEPQWRQAR
ncbi:hypothetical protein IWX48DRAFT_624562 [Phyllosticta citricarpa]